MSDNHAAQPEKESLPLVRSSKTLNTVQQQFRDDQDINAMVERSRRGLPPRNPPKPGQVPLEPVFTAVPAMDYVDMLNFTLEAKHQFDNLPSKVRARFNNNPFELFKFCENKDNLAEAVKLGVAKVPEGYQLMGNKLVQQQKMPLDVNIVRSDDEANPSFKRVNNPPKTGENEGGQT